MKTNKKKLAWIAVLMAVVLVVSMLPGNHVNAADKKPSSSEIREQIDEMEQDKKDLEAQIKALKLQQSNNKKDMKEMIALKNNLDQQVGLLYAQITTINAQVAAYTLLIADKQDELEIAQDHLEKLNKKYKERIRAMEEDGSLSYWSVLFKASSFSDLLDRLNMVEEIASSDQRRLKELSKAAEGVEQAKQELEAEKQALAQMRAELEDKQKDLEKQTVAAQEVLTELMALGDEYLKQMEEFENDQKEMIDKLEQLETEYDEAKYREHMATATTVAPTGTGNGGKPVVDSSGITWLVPCDYKYVSSPWGYRTNPVTGQKNEFHQGVDLAGGGIEGKPIYATRSGVVTYTGWYGSGGWTVKIDHLDGYSSYYLHMQSYDVKPGDYVVAGQIIGKVGRSGGVTGPHLHFEVRLNGSSVNPMTLIG